MKIFFRRTSSLSVLLSTLLIFSAAAGARCAVADEAPTATTASKPVATAGAPVLTADAVQEAFVRAAERIKSSVVTIYAERTPTNADLATDGDNFSSPYKPRDPGEPNTSLGTGMVVDKDGTIVTNYHVVKDATVIRVLFQSSEERFERTLARLIGYDAESDLAVLQISNLVALRAPLRPVEFADSDATRVGEWAIAVGAPFDQAQSVTVGIISAKGRHLDKDNRLSLQDYLQTDASINPGNSGGPLVNLDGKVIGLNTAILSPSRFNVGIGFALPANTVQKFWPQLKSGKAISRGFLGIQYTALDEEVARELGIAGGMQIGALARQGEKFLGPAQAAGLRAGDIIIEVNGRPITTIEEFRRFVAGTAPGASMQLTVLHPIEAAKPRAIKVVLSDWPAQEPPPDTKGAAPALPVSAPISKLGLQVRASGGLNRRERDDLGLGPDETGLVIAEVSPGSPADDAALRRGWKIERIRAASGQWQTPLDEKAFLRLETTIPANSRVLLQVRDRQNIRFYKVVNVP